MIRPILELFLTQRVDRIIPSLPLRVLYYSGPLLTAEKANATGEHAMLSPAKREELR